MESEITYMGLILLPGGIKAIALRNLQPIFDC